MSDYINSLNNTELKNNYFKVYGFAIYKVNK